MSIASNEEPSREHGFRSAFGYKYSAPNEARKIA